MDVAHFELIATIPSQCTLGEGPVWDVRKQILWFTDIQEQQLLRLEWPSQELKRFHLPERLGSLGLTEDPTQLVCAFASGFALYRPETGELHWLSRTEPVYRGLRMNDGRVDRRGCFWAGSMVENSEAAPPEGGSLYRLDPSDGAVPDPVFDGVSISNAICFSPTGDKLYFADTPSQEIGVFDLAEDGSVSNRQTFVSLAADAYPDGADVDASGRVWNAEWGSGRVTAYAPDGSRFAQIELPVSQATCIAFGGPELDLIFVTTAREGLDEAALAAEPDAGNVLVYRSQFSGLSAPLFGTSDV